MRAHKLEKTSWKISMTDQETFGNAKRFLRYFTSQKLSRAVIILKINFASFVFHGSLCDLEGKNCVSMPESRRKWFSLPPHCHGKKFLTFLGIVKKRQNFHQQQSSIYSRKIIYWKFCLFHIDPFFSADEHSMNIQKPNNVNW
jgi:hypothetical protein